jgi:hypothetical protein
MQAHVPAGRSTARAANLLSEAAYLLSEAARLLSEIDDPDNSKHNNDRGQTEAQHAPDIVPGNALSSLARRDDGAPFRALGRTHDILLIRLADRNRFNGSRYG